MESICERKHRQVVMNIKEVREEEDKRQKEVKKISKDKNVIKITTIVQDSKNRKKLHQVLIAKIGRSCVKG